METRTKIVLSLLMATIMCVGSVTSFAIVSVSGSVNERNGLKGLNQDVSQGLMTQSLGSVAIPEDEVYIMTISDCFSEGWDSITASGNSQIDVSLDSEHIYLTPCADWFGIESIDFTAYYNASIGPPSPELGDRLFSAPIPAPEYIPSYSITYNLLIEFYAVNDPPVQIASLQTLYIQSGAVVPKYLDLDNYFSDVDSDLWYSIGPSCSLVDVQISGSTVSVSVEPGITGFDHIVFYATDGEYTAAGDLYAEITRETGTAFEEDATFAYSLNDVFPDPLAYADCQDGGPFSVQVEQSTDGYWAATISAPTDWNGQGYVTFLGIAWISIGPRPTPDECAMIADPGALWAPGTWLKMYVTLETSVGAVNDPPVALPFIPSMLSTDEDVTLYNALDVSTLFYDVDSELTYSAASTYGITDPSVDRSGMLSIVPKTNANGADTIVVSATDGKFTASANLPFYAAPVNDAPYSETDGTLIQTAEDVATTVNVSAMFDDVDGELVYSALSGTNYTVTFDHPNGTATVVPAADWNGAETLTFQADDGELLAQTDAFLVVTAVSDPTVLVTGVPALSFLEDGSGTANLAPHFADVDSQIAFSVATACPGLTVSVANGILSVSSDENWNGEGTVKVTASDGQYSVSTSVDIIVLAVNDQPVALSEIGDITVAEDGRATIDLGERFADVDSILSYVVTGASQLSAVVDEAGTMTISAPENWYGSESLTVVATDGVTELSETVTVTFTPVNDAPIVVSRMEAASFANGEERRLDLRGCFADPDGDALTYAITTPDGITALVDQASGAGLLTASANYSGTDEIIVTATDGYEATSTAMDVVVTKPQAASMQTGLPVEAGYLLGGGMMVMSVFAAVGLSMYAREAGLNSPARRRAKQTIIASA